MYVKFVDRYLQNMQLIAAISFIPKSALITRISRIVVVVVVVVEIEL